MNSDRDEEYMDSRIEGLSREMLRDGMPEEDINTVIQKAKTELLEQFKDQEGRKDMYKNSILMANEDFIKNEENAVNELLKWSPIIYYTSNQVPFITSDNPGFTIKNGTEIYNTNLAIVDSLAFPISPTCALQLKRNSIKQDLLLYRKTKTVIASQDDVSVINAGSFHNCNETILSNLEEQLTITAGYH